MNLLHEKIVLELIQEFSSKDSTISVSLFGSLARDEEKETSDIDIEVVSFDAKEWVLDQSREIKGINIDLVICPLNFVNHQVEKYPYLCYDILNEKILYDPKEFRKDIKRRLRTYFENHPEIVKFWENKLHIMKENKKKGIKSDNVPAIYDEAEILFSKEQKVTRDFFKNES